MKPGDLVNYICFRELNNPQWSQRGVVIKVKGKKWVEVSWTDKLITREHVDDLEISNSGK